jgi:hypothetical protein
VEQLKNRRGSSSRAAHWVSLLLLAFAAFACSSEGPVERLAPPTNGAAASGKDELSGLPLRSALDVSIERLSASAPVDAPQQELRLRWRGGEMRILLERNDALISDRYTTFVLDSAGHLQERDVSSRAPFCHYRGHVQSASGASANLVSFTICDANGADSFTGLLFGSAELVELGLASGSQTQYQLRRVERPAFIDDPASLASPTPIDHVEPLPRVAPDTELRPQAVGPTGPQGQLWVESLAVNDGLRLQRLGSVSAVEQNTLSIENLRAGLYFGSTLSPPVRVALVAQVTFSTDPYTPTMTGSEVNSTDLLQKFSTWGASGLPSYDHRQLLSGFNFDGATIGLAYVGTMCQLSTSTSIVQMIGTNAITAVVAAHELGHSFGMQHDEPLGCGSSFIMSQGTCTNCSTQPQDFSSCSKSGFAAFLAGNVSCLANPVTQTFDGPTCANGIVEAGEQCDCGASNCAGRDPCCNGATCQLVPQAQCSAKDACCDASTCRPVTTPVVCRPAASACDIAEQCAGGATCPADTFGAAGLGCTDPLASNAVCYQGHCWSREQQCASLESTYPSLGTLVPCSDSSCGPLLCLQQSTGTCYQFGSSKFMDGTPCGPGEQCSADVCVSSASLNPGPPAVPGGSSLSALLLLSLLLGAGLRAQQRAPCA